MLDPVQLKERLDNRHLIIDYIHDSGHGWIKVIKYLGFGLKYSRCSYQDKKYLYLEEDCDANLWISELNKVGIIYAYNEIIINGLSEIRDLDTL